jgi:hypothetical protein
LVKRGSQVTLGLQYGVGVVCYATADVLLVYVLLLIRKDVGTDVVVQSARRYQTHLLYHCGRERALLILRMFTDDGG